MKILQSRRPNIAAIFFLAILLFLPAQLLADEDFETEGQIQAITNNSLTVNGFLFSVDSQTIVRGPMEVIIPFSELKVGDFVEVKAIVQPDSSLLAKRIKLHNGMQGIEIDGFIKSKNDSSIVVNRLTFLITNKTMIVNSDEMMVPFSELKEGDFVEVRALHLRDSLFEALKIEIKDERNDIEMKGFVLSIGPDSLVVNRITFYVDNQTVVLGREDSVLSLSDVTVGSFVEIKAVHRTDGTFLATVIKLKEADHHRRKFEVEGTIDEINSDNFVLRGRKFFVNNQTEFFSEDHRMIGFSDLQVGMRAEVKATIQPDSTLLALRVKVKKPRNQEVEFVAKIDSIDGTSLIINQVTVLTDSTTEILDQNRNPITFADLKVGMIVKIKGFIVAEKTVFAVKIKVEDFWRAKITVGGVIDSIGSNYIVLLGHKFFINSSTEIVDANGNPIDFSQLSVGTFVRVKAKITPDGLVALRIKIVGNSETTIVGIIDTVDVNYFVVAGSLIHTNDRTKYFNPADQEVTFADLKSGQTVEVEAILMPDSSYMALTVKIEDDPGFGKVVGIVNSVTNGTISVTAPTFIVTANTIVLNAKFEPISFSSIQSGQSVTVWTEQTPTNETVALQIQTSADIVTGVDDNKLINTLPKEFSLSQNYPNPFNPSTTIRFTVSKAEFVSLKVYNIIGQEITTLVSEQKQPGEYQIQFNASNLASGVYIYRLKAGNFTATKKLVLMK